MTPTQVAEKFSITVWSVYGSCAQGQKRLGCKTRMEAMFRMAEAGWIAEPPLTHAQKLYVQAFDRFLAARRNAELQDKHRDEMRYMLGAMYIEKQIAPRDEIPRNLAFGFDPAVEAMTKLLVMVS